MKTSFLQLGAGGLLSHQLGDQPASGGRWDASPSPTIALYAPTGGCALASTAAVEGPSVALASTAGAGKTTIPLSSTTGVKRWGTYFLGPDSMGRWESVTVDAIGTSSAEVCRPLEHTYSTGAMLESHELFFTASSGLASQVARGCRAEWSFWVDGVLRRESDVYHVGRYVPRYDLPATEVLELAPRAQRLISSGQRLELVIRRLWERYVLADIGRIYTPGALVSGDAATEALLARLQAWLARESKDKEAEDLYLADYRAYIDVLRDSLIDQDEDGAVSDTEQVRGIRCPRLVRG